MRLTVPRIKKLVAEFYGLPLAVIEGRSHARRNAWPRQVAMALSCRYTSFSFPRIGRLFDRDHTTVISAQRAVIARAAASAEYRAELALLCAQIEAGAITQVAAIVLHERARHARRRKALNDTGVADAARASDGMDAYTRALQSAGAKFRNRVTGKPITQPPVAPGPRVLLLRGPDFYAREAA